MRHGKKPTYDWTGRSVTHPAGHRAGSARDDALQANPSGHGSGNMTPAHDTHIKACK